MMMMMFYHQIIFLMFAVVITEAQHCKRKPGCLNTIICDSCDKFTWMADWDENEDGETDGTQDSDENTYACKEWKNQVEGECAKGTKFEGKKCGLVDGWTNVYKILWGSVYPYGLSPTNQVQVGRENFEAEVQRLQRMYPSDLKSDDEGKLWAPAFDDFGNEIEREVTDPAAWYLGTCGSREFTEFDDTNEDLPVWCQVTGTQRVVSD